MMINDQLLLHFGFKGPILYAFLDLHFSSQPPVEQPGAINYLQKRYRSQRKQHV